MSVSGISGGGNSTAQYQSRNPQGPVVKDFRQLVQAIKSGDLAAAQSADSTLTSLLQTSAPSNTSSSSSVNSLNNIQQFLQDVSADLSNNDIAGAQQTLSNFEGQVKGAHHHHHGGGGAGVNSSTATSAATTTDSTSTTAAITTGVNLTV